MRKMQRHWVKHLLREPYIRGIINRRFVYTRPGVTYVWVQYLYPWWRGRITLHQFRQNVQAWEWEHDRI